MKMIGWMADSSQHVAQPHVGQQVAPGEHAGVGQRPAKGSRRDRRARCDIDGGHSVASTGSLRSLSVRSVPVRARNTSSRVGRCRPTSVGVMAAASSARSACWRVATPSVAGRTNVPRCRSYAAGAI